MSDQRIVRPTPISGFPEWLPEIRAEEQRWQDHIRAGFERYGFASVETPSVENLDVLMAKGETSKEVYTLHRVHDGGDDSEARLGLHFDLTVPFARYVAQHFNDLAFPFKRYQIQRVWRGERPQEGRYREFTQCDIDVINVDSVPLHFDAELPRIAHEVLSGLNLPPWTLNINNRKVLQGVYEGLGAPDPMAVIRAVDKLHKIGGGAVRALLTEEAGLTVAQADTCLELAQIRGADRSVVESVRKLGVSSELLDTGLDELGFVLDSLADLPEGSAVADLSIARGLDYYTGTVYEAAFDDDPGYGSIVAGGRYDDLAGQFIRRRLPGVGISIGLTRIFAKLVAEGRLSGGRATPTQVLVVVPSDERRADALRTGAALRRRGVNTEVFHSAAKVGKQVQYASKKGIPFVWFPPFGEDRGHEVKDMATGEQAPADPAAWLPADN
ncbi:histidine--tRNA ligase [Nocardiopsis coralliicola]